MAEKKGWFAKLIAKKYGGTFVGQLIRTVANVYTGGLYSAINPVLPCPPSGRMWQTIDDLHGQYSITGQDVGGSGLVGNQDFGSWSNPINTNSMVEESTSNGQSVTDIINNLATPTANGGSYLLGVSYGCGGSSQLLRSAQRGGFFDILNLPSGNTPFMTPSPLGSPIGIVPESDTNIFALPDATVSTINDLLSGLNMGNIDINNLPQTVVNILDTQLGQDIPVELAQTLGINPVTLDPIDWDFNGDIGGVEFEIGTPTPQPTETSFIDKVKTFFSGTVGIVVLIFVPFSALFYGGWWLFTKKRSKRR